MGTKPSIVAPDGCPLFAAVIGTASLTRSLEFYRDLVGLGIVDRRTLRGTDFEAHWNLPSGTSAETVVLADRGAKVGRVVLMDFGLASRRLIRREPGQRFYGLVNINFYTQNIHEHTRQFQAAGYPPWTEPVQHPMGEAVGAPTEVMIDGPDGIIVNLVELTAGETGSSIARMRAYVRDEFGYNGHGLTPIVTTQHCVHAIDRAVDFYRSVLGMGVLIDVVLSRDELNHFMAYPPGTRSRNVFMQGNHMFGKVALVEPLNVRFRESAPDAVPGAVGYFAQAFVVPDLEGALAVAERQGAEGFSAARPVDIPGLGATRAAIVRAPGSGALQELIQR